MRLLATAIALCAFGLRLTAQSSALPSRLGPDARATVTRIVDSARAAGLPTAPLVDKAHEGVLKGADDARIVLAVRSLVAELGIARTILGGSTDPSLLSATASALHAGVSSADLRRIGHSADGVAVDPTRLATAFVVLVDMVTKHVPPSIAAHAIGDLLQRGAPDRQIVSLRSEVEQDIASGRAPETALLERTRARLKLLDADALQERPLVPLKPAPMQ
jgi:hypothetical protein